MPRNKFPKMPTPRFSHPHGKGNPLRGKNQAQRARLRYAISAMKTDRSPAPNDLW